MGYSEDNFFKNFILGVTSECVQIDTRKLNHDAIVKLTTSAQQQVLIISRYLDPTVFNNDEFIQAASALARRTKSSKLKILVHDTNQMIKNGHKILDLSQRLSSKIEIRTINSEYSQYNQSFVVADTIGYIFNQKADLYDADVNFKDSDRSKELEESFNMMWEPSAQDTAIRRLCI